MLGLALHVAACAWSEAFSVEYDAKKQAGHGRPFGPQVRATASMVAARSWKQEFLKANFPECPLLFKDCV